MKLKKILLLICVVLMPICIILAEERATADFSGLITRSPFQRPRNFGKSAEVKEKEVYELRGIFSSPSGKIFGIYDVNSQKGFWINYHSPVNGIIADSFDEGTKTLSFHSEDGKFSVQLKGILDQSQNAGI